MADPAGVFQVLASRFDPGYKVVFRLPPQFNSSPAPDAIPAFSDPRGVLPAGLAPASQLSYELSDEVSELVIPDRIGADLLTPFLIGSFKATTGQVFVRSETTTSIIVFEGRDVIDLSSKGLDQSSGGIVVPDKVFLPLYAGGRFINSGDDISSKSAQEYIHKSNGNAVNRTAASEVPPLDSLSRNDNVFGMPSSSFKNRVVDVASNKIGTSGTVEFVSYVACDKPIFRDVIVLDTGAIGQGTFSGDGGLVITFAGPFGDPQVKVFRYAFVNTSTVAGESKFQWRLSATFGVTNSNIEKTPDELLKVPGAGSEELSALEEKYYIYNLKDASDDIKKSVPVTTTKKGYLPGIARAKTVKGSKFFDANFDAQIIPFAGTSFFHQSNLQVKSVIGLSPVNAPNRLVSTRTYASPTHLLPLGANTRIGLEYSLHRFYKRQVYGNNDMIVLAKTKPAADGLSGFHDPCTQGDVIFMTESDTITAREFPESSWTTGAKSPPESKLKAFSIGEVPLASAGHSAIFPPSSLLDGVSSGTSGTFGIPADSAIVGAELSGSDEPQENTPIFGLFGSDKETPLYEAIPASSKRSVLGLPPIAASNYRIDNSGGIKLESILIAKKAFLDKMTTEFKTSNPPTAFDKLTKLQLKNIDKQDFPIQGNFVASSILYTKGYQFIAFENGSRIDIGYKPSGTGRSFCLVRDVVFRIPQGTTDSDVEDTAALSPGQALSNDSKRNVPEASMPFMIPNIGDNSVSLFYVYKNRLVVKHLPIEIFTLTAPSGEKFDVKDEANLIASCHRTVATVVYDGGLSDPNDGISADVKYKTLIVPASSSSGTAAGSAVTSFNSTSESPATGSKPQISNYSVCRSGKGRQYAFVGDNSRIRVRCSNNNGASWFDVLPESFFFLPAEKKKQNSPSEQPASQVQSTDGEAPFCFFDEGQETILLFFFSDSSLLTMRIPEEILINGPEKAAASLSKIVPEVIYGQLTDGLSSRGIAIQQHVLDRQKTSDQKETISPQRLAVTRSNPGHLRLYYVDQEKRLHSLISSDGGSQWLSESEYVKA